METPLERLKGAFARVRHASAAADQPVDGAPPETGAEATTGAGAPSAVGDRTFRRRGLIPRWVPWAGGGVAAVAVVAVVLALVFADVQLVKVPSLAGSTRAVAAQRMKALGLVLVVRDTRYSADVPAGEVVAQSPPAGSVIRQGSVVKVDLSAGSESFAMPDVVGQPLDQARQTLRDRGLDVVFDTAASDQIQGTVLSSLPAAGGTVTTGDTVRLTVAAGVSATDTLLPSDLSGLTFVLDPAPSSTGTTQDVTYDIARRVRALLEAAGARVILTRSITDTAATATSVSRLTKAQQTPSTALVGFGIASTGTGGLQVQTMVATSTASAGAAANRTLAAALLSAMRANYSTTSTATLAADTVLQGYGAPAARIRLGSSISQADKISFSDPAWADNVARDVYRALAATYGKR